MLLNTINSEWLKIRSTKSVYWTTALVALIVWGLGLIMGWASGMSLQQAIDDNDMGGAASMVDSMNVSGAIFAFPIFGLMIILIQAVLLVTGEYGNGTAKSNVLAAPKRWQLPVAKWIVYGVISAVITVVVSVIGIYLYKWIAGLQLEDTSVLDEVSMSADGAWTVVLRMTLFSVLGVGLAIGVAYLARRTAGAMAIVLLWSLVLEDLVNLIPKVNDKIYPYMPFWNMRNAVDLVDVPDAAWGQGGSMIYFALVCFVIFIAGLVALRRRDA
jgi:ABC-2 type transport system permease protein